MNNELSLSCELCPHRCSLGEGQTGYCGTRKHIDGQIKNISYGLVTSLAIDPIEKKPLYHFYPGHSILSWGSFGCNMKCPFCQNHEISQRGREMAQGYVSPEELVNMADKATREAGSIGVAFTYNEPLLGYEYLLEVAPLLRRAGQRVVLVTNGQLSRGPLMELLPYIDAMNIDLKVFSAEGYQGLGGDFDTVKGTIAQAVEMGVHVEITTLVVPTLNDDMAMMEAEAQWLAGLGQDIPLHLSRYFPRYKFQIPPTPITVLQQLQNTAKQYLKYVYLGNV
ncbi:AmmeMemoRadiSam system radical SAM enzyme [uncultured Anaerovibrio sp.]|uniref:AmmeMemoRadiSam system radical SAM enzyme n=1 Tax=uncultured Anaerovibrio sp. TaxID=361586 RepID=UPI002607E978|nr:AmmeMemoRadiSam system radical SAM enzyme [uncultured Anaerovibrio sp.]